MRFTEDYEALHQLCARFTSAHARKLLMLAMLQGNTSGSAAVDSEFISMSKFRDFSDEIFSPHPLNIEGHSSHILDASVSVATGHRAYQRMIAAQEAAEALQQRVLSLQEDEGLLQYSVEPVEMELAFTYDSVTEIKALITETVLKEGRMTLAREEDLLLNRLTQELEAASERAIELQQSLHCIKEHKLMARDARIPVEGQLEHACTHAKMMEYKVSSVVA
eukprot:gene29704-37028_t